MCHRITERTPLAVWILYHCQLSSVFVQLCQITFLFLTKYPSSFEFCEHYLDVNHPLYLVTVVISASWLRTRRDVVTRLRTLYSDSGCCHRGLLSTTGATEGELGPGPGPWPGVRHRHRGTLGWHGGRGRHETCCHTDYCAPLLSQEGADNNDSRRTI